MAENIMLALGNQMGRQKAHDVVYEAAQAASTSDRSFREILLEDPEVRSRLSANQIDDLMNPEKYTGLCSYFSEIFVAKAREKAQDLV